MHWTEGWVRSKDDWLYIGLKDGFALKVTGYTLD
jgi:hypothetical protein